MNRETDFRAWLQKTRNLKAGPLSNYPSRIKRVEKNTLNGTDIDHLMIIFQGEDGLEQFEKFLEIFQKNGPHKMSFNTDNPEGVLSDIRTALTAYYFFCEEIPSLDENREVLSLSFDKSQIREVNPKFLKSTFINRLNTQDRLYPNLNYLCFTPRIYNDKKFGELIEDGSFFKSYQNDLINKSFFYVGVECPQKCQFTQIESLMLGNNNGRIHYYAKLKNGVVRELMGKTRDGRFDHLYQQDDNIVGSITLDHVQPISKIIEFVYSKSGLLGITGMSEIIAEVSAQFEIKLNSSARPWKYADFKSAVFEHPKMDKTLAFHVKSDLEEIKELMTLEFMQQSENAGKGNRNSN